MLEQTPTPSTLISGMMVPRAMLRSSRMGGGSVLDASHDASHAPIWSNSLFFFLRCTFSGCREAADDDDTLDMNRADLTAATVKAVLETTVTMAIDMKWSSVMLSLKTFNILTICPFHIRIISYRFVTVLSLVFSLLARAF